MDEQIIDEEITVTLLGSGFAAVQHMVKIRDDFGEYWDVHQTGIGRYESREKAEIEAMQWAESDGVRLRLLAV